MPAAAACVGEAGGSTVGVAEAATSGVSIGTAEAGGGGSEGEAAGSTESSDSGATSGPNRTRSTNAAACCPPGSLTVEIEMVIRPSVIGSLIAGADQTLPSRRMAKYSPTWAEDQVANVCAAVGSRAISTVGDPLASVPIASDEIPVLSSSGCWAAVLTVWPAAYAVGPVGTNWSRPVVPATRSTALTLPAGTVRASRSPAVDALQTIPTALRRARTTRASSSVCAWAARAPDVAWAW